MAAARQAKPGSNRTQLIIGVCAIVLIAAVIVVGVVINRKQTAAPVTDYGASKNSVSTVADGIITATSAGGTGTPVVIDVYQDAMCPGCQLFEHQFGQQIAKAVDEGKLTVRYHMLTFLNPRSSSGDYSTRAAAALMCVGQDTGAAKGALINYVTALYADGTKPEENSGSDLSNDQLATVAGQSGATAAAQACVKEGKNVPVVDPSAKKSEQELQTATGQILTPSVLRDGQPVAVNDPGWLTALIG